MSRSVLSAVAAAAAADGIVAKSLMVTLRWVELPYKCTHTANGRRFDGDPRYRVLKRQLVEV